MFRFHVNFLGYILQRITLTQRNHPCQTTEAQSAIWRLARPKARSASISLCTARKAFRWKKCTFHPPKKMIKIPAPIRRMASNQHTTLWWKKIGGIFWWSLFLAQFFHVFLEKMMHLVAHLESNLILGHALNLNFHYQRYQYLCVVLQLSYASLGHPLLQELPWINDSLDRSIYLGIVIENSWQGILGILFFSLIWIPYQWGWWVCPSKEMGV